MKRNKKRKQTLESAEKGLYRNHRSVLTGNQPSDCQDVTRL